LPAMPLSEREQDGSADIVTPSERGQAPLTTGGPDLAGNLSTPCRDNGEGRPY
jgi:hypothetical protein